MEARSINPYLIGVMGIVGTETGQNSAMNRKTVHNKLIDSHQFKRRREAIRIGMLMIKANCGFIPVKL